MKTPNKQPMSAPDDDDIEHGLDETQKTLHLNGSQSYRRTNGYHTFSELATTVSQKAKMIAATLGGLILSFSIFFKPVIPLYS